MLRGQKFGRIRLGERVENGTKSFVVELRRRDEGRARKEVAEEYLGVGKHGGGRGKF